MDSKWLNPFNDRHKIPSAGCCRIRAEPEGKSMIASWQMVGVASPGREVILLSNAGRCLGEAFNRVCLKFSLFFGLLLCFTAVSPGAANAPATKRVLILHSFGRGFSPF